LWLLEPEGDAEEVDDSSVDGLLRPLAIQWGANRLYSGLYAQSHSYALATNIIGMRDDRRVFLHERLQFRHRIRK
ncbi:hypothetical protein ACC695_40105, partial [Rhizobium ruizarguesonis]